MAAELLGTISILALGKVFLRSTVTQE